MSTVVFLLLSFAFFAIARLMIYEAADADGIIEKTIHWCAVTSSGFASLAFLLMALLGG